MLAKSKEVNKDTVIRCIIEIVKGRRSLSNDEVRTLTAHLRTAGSPELIRLSGGSSAAIDGLLLKLSINDPRQTSGFLSLINEPEVSVRVIQSDTVSGNGLTFHNYTLRTINVRLGTHVLTLPSLASSPAKSGCLIIERYQLIAPGTKEAIVRDFTIKGIENSQYQKAGTEANRNLTGYFNETAIETFSYRITDESKILANVIHLSHFGAYVYPEDIDFNPVQLDEEATTISYRYVDNEDTHHSLFFWSAGGVKKISAIKDRSLTSGLYIAETIGPNKRYTEIRLDQLKSFGFHYSRIDATPAHIEAERKNQLEAKRAQAEETRVEAASLAAKAELEMLELKRAMEADRAEAAVRKAEADLKHQQYVAEMDTLKRKYEQEKLETEERIAKLTAQAQEIKAKAQKEKEENDRIKANAQATADAAKAVKEAESHKQSVFTEALKIVAVVFTTVATVATAVFGIMKLWSSKNA